MQFEFESLVVYDSRVFDPGSHVQRWANRVERNFVRHAMEEAPKRSGELAAGIHGESFRAGPKHWEIHIHSDAPHTMYVLRGTTGPIMSNRMWGFRTNSRTANAPGGLPRGGRYWDRRQHQWMPRMDWLHSHGYALRLRAGYGWPEKFALSVSGQDSNNFMGRAADRTAITNSSLRGFHPSANY